MSNKSEMFRGVTASDIHPTFRKDIAAFSSLSPAGSASLAELLIDDLQNAPTSTSALSRVISRKLGIPPIQATSLARAAKAFATRLGRNDDDPTLVVSDLVEMQIISPTNADVILKFLTAIHEKHADLARSDIRQQTVFGGGHHLGSCSVFTDYRVVFDKFDVSDVDIDNFQPNVTGLVPVITLIMVLHQEGEEEKAIAVRLPEADLTRLERILRTARLQLAAAKTRLTTGG